MLSFSRYAYSAMLRDACFVLLVAALSMVACGNNPRLAMNVGASVALLFSIFLVARAAHFTEERLLRCEAWVALRAEERPYNLERARARMQELLLRFAKNAAGVAGLLYGGALAFSFI